MNNHNTHGDLFWYSVTHLETIQFANANYIFHTEMLKRKDELIQNTLAEKQKIVADILQVPQEDFDNIADVSRQIYNLSYYMWCA